MPSLKDDAMSRRTPLAAALKLLSWVTTILVAGWLGYLICAAAPQASEQVFSAAIASSSSPSSPRSFTAAFSCSAAVCRAGSRLDWPLLLLLGAYGVATVASVAWRVSLESTLIFLLAILVFYALSDLDFLDAHGLQRAFMPPARRRGLGALDRRRRLPRLAEPGQLRPRRLPPQPISSRRPCPRCTASATTPTSWA